MTEERCKLYIIGSQDELGYIYCYAWSKEKVGKKTVKRLVPKNKDDVGYFCVPWWRLYSSKGEVKKELPPLQK